MKTADEKIVKYGLCKLNGGHKFENRTLHDNRYDGIVDECYHCGYERRIRYALGAMLPNRTFTISVPWMERS